MNTMNRSVTLFIAILVAGMQVSAQGISAPGVVQDRELKHSVGFGPSVGWVLDNDKWFWGFAVDCGRRVSERWVLAASLAYDQEIEELKGGLPEKKVNTFTGAGTVAYMVTDQFSLTTGLGMGFLDDDNKEQTYEFTSGDLGTGIVCGYAWPWGTDRSFTVSAAYEWNLTEGESTLSVDGGVSLAF
jgi:hypothetical protein